jgi:hypothetical protein
VKEWEIMDFRFFRKIEQGTTKVRTFEEFRGFESKEDLEWFL